MSEGAKTPRAEWLSDSISFAELKSHLEVERDEHIYVLMSEGRMPGALVGRRWRFHSADIDGWLAALGGRQEIVAHLADWERRRAASLER